MADLTVSFAVRIGQSTYVFVSVEDAVEFAKIYRDERNMDTVVYKLVPTHIFRKKRSGL